MKKMLSLMLVFTMASLASATYVMTYDSVAGTINVETDAAGGPWEDYFCILAPTADITIGTATTSTNASLNLSTIWAGDAASNYVTPPTGQDGPVGFIGSLLSPPINPPFTGVTNEVVLGGIAVTLTNTPVTLSLYRVDGDNGLLYPTAESTLTIPEPATMLILSLGTLLLRRKK